MTYLNVGLLYDTLSVEVNELDVTVVAYVIVLAPSLLL